ncbi:TPA: hypothetical protein ACOECM_001526 [Stenotrophomonas maltophilia]
MDETVYDAAWRAYKAAPRAVANGPSRSAVRAAVDAVLGYLMPPGSTPAFLADRELRRAVAADLMEMGSESQRGGWPAMRATYTVPLFQVPPGPLPTDVAIAAHQRAEQAADLTSAHGWVVADGQGTRWRKWGDFGPEWTADRDAALHFARRTDAEAFAKEDQDAWLIQPVGASAQKVEVSDG